MLPKSHRLPIKDFFGPSALRPMRILRSSLFSLKIYSPKLEFARYGVVVSKKIALKASGRVKIKRIVFNFLSLRHKQLPVFDYLILPVPGLAKISKNLIEKDLASLFVIRSS